MGGVPWGVSCPLLPPPPTLHTWPPNRPFPQHHLTLLAPHLVLTPPPPTPQFGSGFLSKFEAAQCDNRLLEEITLVDTPGQ